MGRRVTAAKILIVTESPQIASIVTSKLEREGMEVFWKRDGRQCLDSLRGQRTELVILESILPDRSGYEVLREIRSSPELGPVPAFVLLDVMQDKTEQDFLRAGASAVFVKPFRPTNLSKQIKKALRSNHVQAYLRSSR